MRMGLLDEAIREHLDLKRRRGADPGEVAREQREALEPEERRAIAESEEGAELEQPPADGAGQDLDLPEAGVMAGGVPEDMPDDFADAPEEGPRPGAPGMDETAELDMRTVLDEEPARTGEQTTPGVAGGLRPASDAGAPSSREDSLEWEMPGDEAGAEL